MSEVVEKKWAVIHSNDEFICVLTQSGYRRSAMDSSGKLVLLAPNVEPKDFGQAILDALSASRFLKLDELEDFFAPAAIEERYENWVVFLMQKFGYSTRRNLFRNMQLCHVEWAKGLITMTPTCHEKLEAWGGKRISKEDEVEIAETASAQELGEAALLALSRCVS